MMIFNCTLLLFSTPFKGLLFLTLLFLVCLIGVHVVQLTKLGWEYKIKRATENESAEKQKEEKKPPTQDAGEPVYYIVERKTRRVKSSYGEPKQIRFRKDE